MGHKPWENWARLICCLQDLTIHHKDLHINFPVQQYIPDHIYYNKICVINLMHMEIRKQIIFQWKILQLLRHFQCIKGTAKSIISWPNIKQITTILFESKPVTFQNHLMTSLHNLNKLPKLEFILNNTYIYNRS